MTAKQYIKSLTYHTWHKLSDVPDNILPEVINLIDTNNDWQCGFLFNDFDTEFMRVNYSRLKRLI